MSFRPAVYVWLRYVVAAILVGMPALAAGRDSITGDPQIVDGDTIWIGPTKIRLEGIDAPESDQICLNAAGEAWTVAYLHVTNLQSEPLTRSGNVT